MTALLRHPALVVLLLGAAYVLPGIRTVASQSLGWWYLGDVVRFACYALAAQVMLRLAIDVRALLPGTFRAKVIEPLAFGVAIALLETGVSGVLAPPFRETFALVYSVAIVGAAGWLIWLCYADFESVVTGVRQTRALTAPYFAAMRPAPTPPASPTAVPTCAACGSPIEMSQRFCGVCGKPSGVQYG